MSKTNPMKKPETNSSAYAEQEVPVSLVAPVVCVNLVANPVTSHQ
jgi:hypothetical protein